MPDTYKCANCGGGPDWHMDGCRVGHPELRSGSAALHKIKIEIPNGEQFMARVTLDEREVKGITKLSLLIPDEKWTEAAKVHLELTGDIEVEGEVEVEQSVSVGH